jgi:hypothetical protein
MASQAQPLWEKARDAWGRRGVQMRADGLNPMRRRRGGRAAAMLEPRHDLRGDFRRTHRPTQRPGG